MKAIGFDLGKTLIDYKDVPSSWQSLYHEALTDVAVKCGCKVTNDLIEKGKQVLTKYNTRINPRLTEVASETIFREILAFWGLSTGDYLEIAESAFFTYFRKELVVFDDTLRILQFLKDKNIKIGVLTDVPYGMSHKFLELDLAPIAEYIDVVLSSVDVGVRKPDRKGYMDLAAGLHVNACDMAFVGDEEKDIKGADKAGMFSVLIDRSGRSAGYGENKRIASLLELRKLHFIPL